MNISAQKQKVGSWNYGNTLPRLKSKQNLPRALFKRRVGPNVDKNSFLKIVKMWLETPNV